MPDIDIDFGDRNKILDLLDHRIAKLSSGKKHNTGVYFTEIPHDPITDIAILDFKEAEEKGYFKLDFLNVSIYNKIKNEEHLDKLMQTEPIWELLEHKEFVDQLFHLAGHHLICKKLQPKTIEDLACVLAIVRPAKRNLLNETWGTIRKEVWKKPTDGSYFFKKAHAISYAMVVVVHMNLICEEITS